MMQSGRALSGLSSWFLCWASLLGLLGLMASLPVRALELRFERLFTDAEVAGQGVGAIRVIVQDKRGFIWLGGENGLARYDGVRLKRYLSDPRTPNTLTSSYVRDIQIDHDGVMWIATDLGLCRYNETTDDFRAFMAGPPPTAISHNVVMSLALDSKNNLYLGTGDGINVFDASRSRFQRYYPQPTEVGDTGVNSIQDIFIDSRQRIWLGTGELGLALFTPQTQKYQFFQHDKDDPSTIASDNIRTIDEDDQGRLWIGTYGGGLSRMSAEDATFANFRHNPADPGSIGSNSIWDIYQDSQGTIWISTDQGGLARYVEATGSFVHYKHSPYDRDSISSDVVRTVFEDKEKDLWVGTFPSGVNYYSRAISKFSNYSHKPDDDNSLSHSAILSFFEDRDGLIWIGNEGGLDSFDRQTKTFTRHNTRPGEAGGLRSNAVLAIQEDYNGDLWLGTWSGGLHRYDRKTGIFHNYFPDKEVAGSINSAFVWSLLLDKNNNLWVGTETGGLNLYNRETDSFTSYMHDPDNKSSISGNFLWALLEDSQGNFWIGSINGLDRFDRATGTFIRYTENSTDPEAFSRIIRIRSLAEDTRGRIWIGTQDNGAFVYDPVTDRYTRLDETKGLPSPYVPSIIGDNLGNMWLTTGNGVARVNEETLAVTSYRKGHGLVGNIFNRDATLKDREGKMYFGGADGFSVLDPATLADPRAEFPTIITDFRIFNRPVAIGGKGDPLTSSLVTAQQITLNHSHSMFSFEFAALNYRFASRNQYAYMLEGFDKSWNFTGNDNTATYTNIGAGEYVFKVKGANGDGVWSEHIAEKSVTILPPPWRTWWAFSLYAGMALLSVGFLFRVKARQMEFRSEKALNAELMRVNKIKDTFLANTSHELRTPLNGIIGIAESLADSPLIRSSEEAFHRLNLIVFSGKRLSNLINDILDYSKLTERKLEIFCKPVNIRSLTDDVFQLLGPLAEAKNIGLENAVEENAPPVHADENRLQQIMINLVGNGIKYSDAGTVRVYCRAGESRMEVIVEDTGAGIPRDQYDNVFKAFLQLEGSDSRRHGGTGLGLSVTKQLVELHGGKIWVESEEGVGSKFIFTLGYSDTASSTQLAPSLNATTTASAELKQPKVRVRGQKRTNAATVDDIELPQAPENAAGYTLLIVDDDPVNRMVLAGTLGLHKYSVLEAASGVEALAIIEEGAKVDMVILDVMMPEMNGYETCKAIRERYSLHEMPVIFLTAKKVDEDIAKAFAAGGTEILTKPVSKHEILPRVANQLKLLDIYRAAERNRRWNFK